MAKHKCPHWTFSKLLLCVKKLSFSLWNQAQWSFPLLKKKYSYGQVMPRQYKVQEPFQKKTSWYSAKCDPYSHRKH